MPSVVFPEPSEVTHLRPRNARATVILVACCSGTALSLFLSAHASWLVWLTGQLLLAVCLVQWFVLLHECGHGVLFRQRRLNTAAGHLASLFSGIPYHCWTPIHGLHHKWTGWQDRDPTTMGLVPRPLKAVEKFIIDVCWRWWIPLFTPLYRITNFWHLPKLQRLFPRGARRRLINVLLLAAMYLGIIWLVGVGPLLRLVGVGLVLSMIFLDPLLLSQHTHMPMKLSHGEKVAAFSTRQQLPFTRSLRFPSWFSAAVLLHFDAHELHHMYPQVPGYDLRRIDVPTDNDFIWWRWIAQARRLPAHVFLFQNRDKSGSTV